MCEVGCVLANEITWTNDAPELPRVPQASWRAAGSLKHGCMGVLAGPTTSADPTDQGFPSVSQRTSLPALHSGDP